MNFLNDLKWRYATKKFDTTKKVSQEDLDKILEAIRLTPTSSGLEQFRVLVITNQELKDKIVPLAWGQKIVADCSHLLVFAAWDKYTEERLDIMFDYTASVRGLSPHVYDDYKARLKSMYLTQTPNENFVHTSAQSYIGLGFAMAAAAELKIDSTPMEGFSREELDKLLDLQSLGLRSVTMLPIGYRDTENDWLVNMQKVRLPKEDFVIYYE